MTQRLRITFSKGPELKYTSHLDLVRLWERVFRRAEAPLAYSRGFNPRPKMYLAAALPLGFSSRCEILDVFLDRPVPPGEFREGLLQQLPRGLTIHSVEEVEPGGPALQSQLCLIEYGVQVEAPVLRGEVQRRVEELLQADSLPRERRGKGYDLRPLVDAVWLEGHGDGVMCLGMRLRAGAAGTGRPDEVMDALGLSDGVVSVERQKIVFQV